jgi:PAS domain S-box-containing protein
VTTEPDQRTGISQAFLASIIESSDDAIVSKDLNGIIGTWNKGAERIFGYPAEEVIGQPITILIPQHLHDEEVRILGRISATVSASNTMRRCGAARTGR